MNLVDWGWVIPATAWILIPLGGMAVGVVMQWLRSKERMLAIEKGVPVPPSPWNQHLDRTRDPWKLAESLRLAGLVLVAIGLGVTALLVSLSLSLPDFPKGVIAAGTIPLLIGVALLIEHRVRSRELGPRPSPPASTLQLPGAGE
jgi:hypothetical protein